jgi:hypothetical protein
MFKFIDSMSFVFNCFCSQKLEEKNEKENENDIFAKNMYDLSAKHNISILPIQNNFELENLYPKSNHVQDWITFVIGKDKTYILANTGSNVFGNSRQLVNHKASGFLPNSLEEFLDPIWERTLSGSDMQFFMLYDGKTYFVNTYSFKNKSNNVIGASMFMRLFDTLPNLFQMYSRLSLDNPVKCINDNKKN